MYASWITTNLKEIINDHREPFLLKFKPYEFMYTSFHHAAKEGILEIANLCPIDKRLYIPLSGGMDSEYVLKISLDNNVPVTPLIIHGFGNSEEVSWAIKYCKKRNVTPVIINVTEKEFFLAWYLNIGARNSIYSTPNVIADDYARKNSGILVSGESPPLCEDYAGIAARNSVYVVSNNIIADYYARKNSGILISGDAPPLCDDHIEQLNQPMVNCVELCEHDFYLKELYGHVGGLFTYNLPILYSYIKEADRSLSVQRAKAKLYEVELRNKMRANLPLDLRRCIQVIMNQRIVANQTIKIKKIESVESFFGAWQKKFVSPL